MNRIIKRKIQCIVAMCLVATTNLTASTIKIDESIVLQNDLQKVSSIVGKEGFRDIPGFPVSPLQIKGEVISEFNQDRGSYIHEGVDVRAVMGTPIFASDDGIVTKAAPDSKGIDNGGGNMIFINYGQGVEGRYMHLSRYNVVEGQNISRGDIIGFTGNTGDSEGPHLHLEYRVDGIPMNPLFIFEGNGMIKNDDTSVVGDESGDFLYDTGFLVIQH